ncbi:beta/gamma crystallin domain-containing protein [Micromonospora sp. CA-246542]|uniref:beta/gamma crystallin domain-containing protein n=1 Tax=Micromonospora sp. CA-246542 TaxID=3239959 RepID=UPI003D89E1DE
MKTRVKKIALGAVAGLALTIALPASPALAINSVSCGTRTDFLKLDITLGTVGMARCFASRGVTAVNIGGVHHYTSGNNKVTVNYEAGGQYHTSTVDKWYGVDFGRTVRVYEVRIW